MEVNAYWKKPPEPIVRRAKEWLRRLLYGVVYLAQRYANEMATWAQKNRRWTDRTSAARGGLFGRVVTLEAGHVQAVIGHSVEYGIWLEVRWGGKYGILLRSLKHNSRPFWHDFVDLVFEF